VGWLSIMFQEWWLMERYYYCFSRLPLFSLVIIACCCSLSVRNTTATHNIHTYVQCGLDLFSVRFHWSISSSWLAPQGIVTLYRYVVQSDWIRLVFLYTKLIVGGKYSKYQMDYAIYLADCTCRSAHSLESIFFNSIQ
jgi:hypothetical protein